MPFKSYTQNQLSLLPPSLEELVPANDPVRVINAVVDRLKLTEVEKQYKKTGCSAYHPRMMIKVIIYAYLRNTYSSRRIEDFVANDIRFMWLSGMQRPDHNTINLFRSSKLNGTLNNDLIVTVKSDYGHFPVRGLLIPMQADREGLLFSIWTKNIEQLRTAAQEGMLVDDVDRLDELKQLKDFSNPVLFYMKFKEPMQ
jgi:transposase